MQFETILSSLENIPRAAILLFVVLGVVLAVEIWYLRPKRKLPPIPKTEEAPAAPPPSLGLIGFRPLSQRQILIIAFLLILLVVVPLGAILLKQTWEAKKRLVALPSPLPTITPLLTPRPPTPSPAPTPFFSPAPKFIASPSATPPEKLAKALPTPTPTISPTPTPPPTKSPGPAGKGAPETPSPSPELPSVKKPKELPDASVSAQLILLALLSLSAFSVGIITLRREGQGIFDKKR